MSERNQSRRFAYTPVRTLEESYRIALDQSLSKTSLLLSTMNSTQIRRPVFHIELDIDSSPQIRLALVQRASLDDRLARHDLQLRV